MERSKIVIIDEEHEITEETMRVIAELTKDNKFSSKTYIGTPKRPAMSAAVKGGPGERDNEGSE